MDFLPIVRKRSFGIHPWFLSLIQLAVQQNYELTGKKLWHQLLLVGGENYFFWTDQFGHFLYIAIHWNLSHKFKILTSQSISQIPIKKIPTKLGKVLLIWQLSNYVCQCPKNGQGLSVIRSVQFLGGSKKWTGSVHHPVSHFWDLPKNGWHLSVICAI